MDDKKALAHTVKERHRRLCISSAIKRITDLLSVHGSKLEILEVAAAWISDVKSKSGKVAVEDQARRTTTGRIDTILREHSANDCSES